ncbi:phosphate ABC transporter substrate-binding protein PstS [Stenoxybacter acetivorans]|uniref:phosphate ABC transporter substrate-binding protein PstS n=1 Tax=Stenoxybacter acetivorans TaxID=422441 RepID=UPI000AB81319|nr:phosphate ABC transporter substrate-binding protein PstS [Stenoxybacter acetivorans]
MMNMRLISVVMLAAVGLAACSDQASNKPVAGTTASAAGDAAHVTGAGASFPQPVYVQWANAYQSASSVQVNYQSIGSSGGIKQITAKTVDFGASDAPMSKEELDKAGLIQFPTVIGGVVPVVNIEGIDAGQLKLNGEILANIYLGKINKWNDAAIAALNPGLNLPDALITTVFRSDGSGTTFVFTDYLSKASADWKNAVGADKSVKWPTSGSGAAGKGNEGVSAYVGRVKNAIGYVEYAYAKQNHMAHVSMQNKAGQFVQPSQEGFEAAAQADWQSALGFNLVLTNQDAPQAWPLAAATFILMHKQAVDAAQSRAALSFFDWAFKNGNESAAQLDYVPLPDSVKDLIRQEWRQITDASGKPIYEAQ